MTLSTDNQWKKRTYGPGVFINEVEVAAAEDISGTTPPFMDRPVDIGIKLTLEIGKNFQPVLSITGNFKRDTDTGEVIGWGSAFVVQEALSRLGFKGELDQENRIPADALQRVIGKSFLRLSYISGEKQNGKPRYSDWGRMASTEEGAEELAKRFKQSVAKGYPKNYRPELLDQLAERRSVHSAADEVIF
jgi:hypothetical protein